MRHVAVRPVFVLLLVLVFFTSTMADDDRFEVGPRWAVVTAGGEPANDMSGFGAFFRYRFKDKWFLGVGFDLIGGDFERPSNIVGISSTDEIDAKIDNDTVSAWIERQYGNLAKKLRWFWMAGLGYTSPDIERVTGPVTGGGTFDISTEADSEAIVLAGIGVRRPFSKHWNWEVALRVDHHFADWTLTDSVSGMTGTIDGYTNRGLQFTVAYGF